MVSNKTHLAVVVELARERTLRESAERTAIDAERILAEARGQNTIFDRENSTHHTQIAFLCARVNQLEKERAILVRHVTQIEFPVPELATMARPSAPMVEDPVDALLRAGSNIFEDMGDTDALKHGVGWGKDGSVRYGDETAAASKG